MRGCWLNMLMYLIIAVFVGTLMIGRTPGFFGKKIGTKEMQVAVTVNMVQIFVPVALATVACFIYVNKSGGAGTLGWLSNKGWFNESENIYTCVIRDTKNGFSDIWSISIFHYHHSYCAKFVRYVMVGPITEYFNLKV